MFQRQDLTRHAFFESFLIVSYISILKKIYLSLSKSKDILKI